MPNYFYIDANGQKQGLINDQQLQALAAQGVVTPNTPLETDSGHKGLAGQIPGLFAPPPFAQPAQTPPSSNLFCTSCGNPIAEHAIACMSCGAKPTGHRDFCRHCGVALNPRQVICIKCGAGISTAGASRSISGGSSSGTSWEKKKLVAGLLGIFLGGLGAHKFYMGSWGWGIIFLVLCWTYIPAIIGLIEGIMFLVMSEEKFTEKYPPETEAPFRW